MFLFLFRSSHRRCSATFLKKRLRYTFFSKNTSGACFFLFPVIFLFWKNITTLLLDENFILFQVFMKICMFYQFIWNLQGFLFLQGDDTWFKKFFFPKFSIDEIFFFSKYSYKGICCYEEYKVTLFIVKIWILRIL